MGPLKKFTVADQTNRNVPKFQNTSKMFENYLKIKMRSEEKEHHLPGVSDLRQKN